MAKVKLVCGVYGEGSVFFIEIEHNAKVSALQEAIFYKQRYNHQYTFAPSRLTLYLARKKEGEESKWLKDDHEVKSFLRSGISTEYEEMRPTWILDEDYFEMNFQPGRKEIHVLVELPKAAATVEPTMGAVFWLVTGSVENALYQRGIRSVLYQIADAELGYYDPTNVLSDKKVHAFWYTNNDLQIRVLFKEEAHALYFQSRLNAESITSLVSPAPCPQIQQRTFTRDYVAEEFESPQETTSSVPTEFSVIDQDNPVFKYQRIEAYGLFGPHGKAESAHLMSRSHCRRFKSCAQYDDDDNNRLALSLGMHGAYDSLGFDFPVVDMEVVSVSDGPVLDNRYKVDLLVSVHSHHYSFLLGRLKDESTRTSDPLVMKTFVHVEDPVIFRTCMAWKHKKVEQLRQDYFSMN
ncbi:hypothetical protein PF011_g7286 [Phytophthora fragariae]|uniref:Crinkler effector protein N-terminal domain-containing protein n=1 Tax=Phytophthora fragariae TaxID=53985 RepID=A0A6A3LCQ5_9STRA|nr:hypothetical protein PF011_g7286 [Phytophthora fragariae]